MTLSQIYTNITSLLASDGNDGVITLDRFNVVLPSVLYELIRSKNEELEKTKGFRGSYLSSKILKNLVYYKTNVTVTSGRFALTAAALDSDFLYWGDLWTYSAYGTQKRRIELVKSDELAKRLNDLIMPNLSENPVAHISRVSTTDYAYIWPTNITAVDIIFIRKPTTPFLDYYIDANSERQFMAASSSHTLTAGEVYRDGTTSGTKSSATVELEIPEDFHPEYQDKLLERLSMVLNDQFGVQYSLTKQQQEDRE